ncbi:MAG: STAS domain-containing protein [Gaiella sp.]
MDDSGGLAPDLADDLGDRVEVTLGHSGARRSGERGQAGDPVGLLRLGGELDAYSAPDVRASIAALFGSAPRRVVVDLSAVTFLDSTVLGLLVGALRRARESGRDLAFVLPGGPARRIFEITGLEQVFPAAALSDLEGASEVLAEPQHGPGSG